MATFVNNLGKGPPRPRVTWPGHAKPVELVLAIDETVDGPNHSDMAIFVNNLGLLLLDLGDYAGHVQPSSGPVAIEEAYLWPRPPRRGHSL